MAYLSPRVETFQQFQSTPTAPTLPQSACIVGPHAQLVRYAIAGEKPNGLLGAYVPGADTAYNWPNLATGGIVDLAYTKLFADNAQLVYWSHSSGVGSAVAPVAGKPNQIQIAGSNGFKANGVSYPRLTALYNRDVQVGDKVHLTATVSSVAYDFTSYVTGFAGAAVAATTGTLTYDSGNATTQSASSTPTQTAGTTSTLTLAGILTNYNGLADGAINETYTFAVTHGSTGDDLTTATLSMTSASGLDNVASFTPGANNHATISNVAVTSNVATITTSAAHGFTSGATVVVAGLTNSALNGTWVLTSASGTTFTFAITHADIGSTADAGTADSGTPVTVGDRGLKISFTGVADLLLGQTWTLAVHESFTATVATSGGTYTGPNDDTYIVTVSKGGLITDSPQVTITTVKGLDQSGPLAITAANQAYAIGTYGVTFKLAAGTTAIETGDKFYIPVTAATTGTMNTLILANPLPSGLQAATDMDVSLYVQKNVQVPLDRVGHDPTTNFTAAASSFTVASGITLRDPLFVDTVGNQIDLTLGGATLYVQYRAWLPDLSATVDGISDIGSLGTAISGAVDPDNPLAWHVSKALATAGGTTVYYIGVSNPDDPTSWNTAIASLVGDDRIYGLVPVTYNSTVLQAFVAHVNDQSSPEKGLFREMFVNLKATTTKVKVAQSTSTDGNIVLATIAQNTDAPGTVYTLLSVPADNAHFLTNGVQPGDLVYYNWTTSFGQSVYTTYVVSSVVSENELILVSGPSGPVTQAQKVEIWHPLSKTEQAADLASQAGSYANSRVCAVWPDQVGIGGVTVDGTSVCAALAGLRAAGPPHQGLTNLPIVGFDDLTRTTSYFNATQLDTMAQGGVWIVTRQSAALGGAVVSRQAINSVGGEEMDVANVDSISVQIQNRLNPFIGVANVTPTALQLLQVEIGAAINNLKQPYNNAIGSQLIDGTIVSISPSAVFKDRVVIILNLTVPTPINIIENHLLIA